MVTLHSTDTFDPPLGHSYRLVSIRGFLLLLANDDVGFAADRNARTIQADALAWSGLPRESDIAGDDQIAGRSNDAANVEHHRASGCTHRVAK